MTEPKILLAAPIHDSKAYIIKDYLANVDMLDYDVDRLWVDNSKDMKWLTHFPSYNIRKLQKYLPTSRQRQCVALNYIRETFLSRDWTHLFLLESDLIPEPDIVQHLLKHDCDAVSAVYLLDKEKGISNVTKNIFIAINRGWSNVFVLPGFIDGELKRVPLGCGLGCVLIRREVLEKIPFRCGSLHADSYFWQDFQADGWKGFVDTSQVVRHYPNPSGKYDSF